jgi:hyperosmotically inducible periplasmic protein
MKTIMCAAIASVVLVSCMKNEQPTTTTPTVQTQPAWADKGEESDLKADENAVKLIRCSLSTNKSLPTNGKNVILIIADGTVTLRGAVRSEQEKLSIGAMAKQYAGTKDINNQLEIIN